MNTTLEMRHSNVIPYYPGLTHMSWMFDFTKHHGILHVPSSSQAGKRLIPLLFLSIDTMTLGNTVLHSEDMAKPPGWGLLHHNFV